MQCSCAHAHKAPTDRLDAVGGYLLVRLDAVGRYLQVVSAARWPLSGVVGQARFDDAELFKPGIGTVRKSQEA